MSKIKKQIIPNLFLFILVLLFFLFPVHGQVEFMPWGNITGIRIEGERIAFESSVRIVKNDWKEISQTRHYALVPSFKNLGNTYFCESRLNEISFSETVKNTASGSVSVSLKMNAEADVNTDGVFFCMEFSEKEYAGGFISFQDNGKKKIPFGSAFKPGAEAKFITTAKGVTISSEKRNIGILFPENMEIVVVKAPSQTHENKEEWFYHVYFTLLKGELKKNTGKTVDFTIQASGTIDRDPVVIRFDPKKPGRAFAGIGGNFRLQFPENDPEVIRYCLDSLNVTWSRIGMWWSDWHPEENTDPYENAKNGKLKPLVYHQMEMAQELAKRHIPVIVSAWFPPEWAKLSVERLPGTYGDHLNPVKWKAITESITRYLLYLKNEYGVEAELFSFNEPEIGVQVVQNPAEHITFIKMLGKSFAENGLKTKLILAETSNATPYALDFVRAGINDHDASRYIGAFGFHTWGGCEDENLTQWAGYASVLQLPLMVTESGPDSEAHRNPDLFLEPWYQQNEIDLYIRLCRICQPLTIMEWQLTADYSVLTGNGIYGTKGSLSPTRRFWNLRQLGLTPAGSFALPVNYPERNIQAAAFGDILNGIYTLHIVNNGAKRKATVLGIPGNITEINVYTTGFYKNMEMKTVSVENGKAEFEMDAGSYITLIND